MLGWVLTFLVLSAVAAYLSFFALAGTAGIVAKVFLAVFLVLLVASATMTVLIRRRGTT